MAAIDYDQFVDKLCAFLAAAGSLTYGPTPTKDAPNQLWRHSVVEAFATDPYAVIAAYGGHLPIVPVASVSLQFRGNGSSVGATMSLCQKLYNGLVDAIGRPLRNLTFGQVNSAGGFCIAAARPNKPPCPMGRDDRGREEVVFNCDFDVIALP